MSGTLTRRRLGESLDDDRTEWERVDAASDAAIAAAIADDPDAIDPGREWLEQALSLRPGASRERLSLNVDSDVVAWFRAQGRGWQTRMNAVLRAYVEAQRRKAG